MYEQPLLGAAFLCSGERIEYRKCFDKASIDAAVRQAVGGAPATSPRPKQRPQMFASEQEAKMAAIKAGYKEGEFQVQKLSGGKFTYVQTVPDQSNIGSREIAPNGQVTGSTRGFNTESEIDAAFDKLLGQFADNFSAQVDEGGMSDIDIQAQEFAQDAIEMAKDIQKDDYYFSDSTYYEFTDGLDIDDDMLMDHDLVQQVLRALPNVDMEDEEIKQRVDALANMNIEEGNAYAHAVRKAKMNGAEKGDKIDHPDSDEDDIVIEKDKTPLGEFILSYFDRQTGQFPKGETAVLTSVEKDYGDQYVKPASQFIERLGHVYEKYQARKMADFTRIQELAGLR